MMRDEMVIEIGIYTKYVFSKSTQVRAYKVLLFVS